MTWRRSLSVLPRLLGETCTFPQGPHSQRANSSIIAIRRSLEVKQRGGWLQQRRGLSIRLENTPNPNSLMFFPGVQVLETGTMDFPNESSASPSPLALALFKIPGVVGVFFGKDFITVSKVDSEDTWSEGWAEIIDKVKQTLEDFFASGKPVVAGPVPTEEASTEGGDDIVSLIKQVLDEKIRPTVQEDGGDVIFLGFDEKTGTLKLKMQGACTSCPSSINTLRNGVLNMMQYYFAEVKNVIQIMPEEEKIALSEFERFEKLQEEKRKLEESKKKPKDE